MSRKFNNPKRVVADIIRSAYAGLPITIRPRPPVAVKEMIATITVRGIGDCIMLTDLAACGTKVWVGLADFVEIMAFHPNCKFESVDNGLLNPFLADILRLREMFDLGNGHQLQQLRRAWGLPVDLKPKGALRRTITAQKDRVILHFEPSPRNVSWQRKYWHPRMREFYPESKEQLEKFIRKRQDLEFIQVGRENLRIRGAHYAECANTTELIKTIQTGSWFIGIMSGPMHVATAYGLRCIVVVNHPKNIVLPVLKRTGTHEEEWMYPQNVHLHQETSSPLVPSFSVSSLEAAFNGDVYPFWLDDWLGLIND